MKSIPAERVSAHMSWGRGEPGVSEEQPGDWWGCSRGRSGQRGGRQGRGVEGAHQEPLQVTVGTLVPKWSGGGAGRSRVIDHQGLDCQANELGRQSLGKQVDTMEEINKSFDYPNCKTSKYQGQRNPQIKIKVKSTGKNILQNTLWWKG